MSGVSVWESGAGGQRYLDAECEDGDNNFKQQS